MFLVAAEGFDDRGAGSSPAAAARLVHPKSVTDRSETGEVGRAETLFR
jgi:hypothetical protein